MDEDFEDLLRDEEFSSPEKSAVARLPTLNIDEKAIPSENELRLGKRVLELEKERDDLIAEITKLKAQQPPRHPTIPISPASQAQSQTSSGPIEIPPPLIPVLAILRQHVTELTKDNQALRYTFLGSEKPNKGSIKTTQNPIIASPLPIPASGGGPSTSMPMSATSSKLTLDVDMVSSPNPTLGNPPKPSTPTTGMGISNIRFAQVDIEKVLDRVKNLIEENEELGEMILEIGRRDDFQVQWEKAMDGELVYHLISDLTHHLTVVQSLRSELSSYKSHFGPIPSTTSASSSSTLNAPHKHSISGSGPSTPTRPSHHSHSHQHQHQRDRDRDRDRDRGRDSSAGNRSDRSHHISERERERDAPPRRTDNQLSIRGASANNNASAIAGGPRKDDRDRSNQQGRIPSGPSHRNGNGNGTGNGDGNASKDDRAYKRRR
uniref:Uncharacterized protein n=1 Tax=Kwoniella dejecticola CBS 10117 TaxID=1296121 RepID=A0A1A5ZX87_9TREE|nr:uncharacterized protein I303_07176 [Kwoniella dejecticola CBS 10117]OBR82417.1 hypothetical protein I303_07176 [Kwoniella dejecticola CBS 10117]